MGNAFYFLIDTLFSMLLMVVLLRLWLQLARADFYNPLSQFVVKFTNPLVIPLRRFIPSIGALDSSTILLALIIAALKLLLLQLLFLGQVSPLSSLIGGAITVVQEGFRLLFWVLIIRAILSWVSQDYNPTTALLSQLTEPLLAPIRRIIPAIGGLDLSILVLLLALQFLQVLFQNMLQYI